MMSLDATSQRRCSRRVPGCFARLRSKYGWCCRSKRQPRKVIKHEHDDTDLFNPLGQLLSWVTPSRRVTRPTAGTREVTSVCWNSVAEHGSGHEYSHQGGSWDTMTSLRERPPLLHSMTRGFSPTSSIISPATSVCASTSATAAAFAVASGASPGGGIARSPLAAVMAMPDTPAKTYPDSTSGSGSVVEETNAKSAELSKGEEMKPEAESVNKVDNENVTDVKADAGVGSGITIDTRGGGGGEIMVPIIDQDQEVEEASFMPRAFRSTTDSLMRRWQAADLRTTALDAEIGGGTFAKVVLGQTSLGVPLAIKVITRDSEDFGSQDKYINREIEALTMTADHPNVVDIIGTLKTAHTTFMVMPLIETDAAKLIKQRVLYENEVVPMSIQLMSALEHLHDMNIVHRDLKPANLLVTQDMHVRLADFGFAKMLEEEGGTMTGLCGTKPYLSPEQVNSLPYGTAADVWAAGVVVYELLMGVTAFCPDSSIDLGPISTTTSASMEGDIRMRLDPYDELERENIRSGVFEVDSGRVGAVGEDFLRKLIMLDPVERMSARQAGEHAWFGGVEQALLKRADVAAATKERSEGRENDKRERAQLLRSRRRRRVPKMVKTARAPAPVAEGAPQSAASDSTAGVASTLTVSSAASTPVAGMGVPRALTVGKSGSTSAEGGTAVDGTPEAMGSMATLAV